VHPSCFADIVGKADKPIFPDDVPGVGMWGACNKGDDFVPTRKINATSQCNMMRSVVSFILTVKHWKANLRN